MEEFAREITLMSWVGPVVPAVVFVVAMSVVPEPARQKLNAIGTGGLSAIYINGGFGGWEFVYMVAATVPAYLGLRSYTFIGVAWLMHTGWDLAHHFYGNPLWHWSEMSSFGCAVMDALVALWFFAGAPSVFERFRERSPLAGPAS